MRIKPTLLAAAAISLLSTGAYAVDFGGYFRVGPGQKQSAGDDRRCHNGLALGGKGGIGRLGNECETYAEFALSQGGKAGGVDYKALVMTNFGRGGSDVGDEKVGVAQIYAEGKGFDIAPNQTFWIGKRFYGRADVHMDDTFFVNMTGTGAGVDGIDLGLGSLNVAVFRQGDNDTNPGSRLNLDLTGINVNPGGKLRGTFVYTDYSGPDGETGYGLSLQHDQAGLLGGDNTFWAQYTTGTAGLDMGFRTTNIAGVDIPITAQDSDFKQWRLVESLQWKNGPLSGQVLLQIGEAGTDDTKFKFNSIAGRAAFAMTKNFKIQAELGTSSGKVEGSETARVTKFTIAPTLTVGPNYYDRPELRFYVSTFKFNDAYQALNGLSKSSKTAAGFQAEMWF
jgi:maltoporin